MDPNSHFINLLYYDVKLKKLFIEYLVQVGDDLSYLFHFGVELLLISLRAISLGRVLCPTERYKGDGK